MVKIKKTDKKYNPNDLRKIMEGKVEMEFLPSVPMGRLMDIVTDGAWSKKPDYQREPGDDRRLPFEKAVFLSMVQRAVLVAEGKLSTSSSLSLGTSLAAYAVKNDAIPDKVFFDRSPVYVVVDKLDDGKIHYLRSPEGNGLLYTIPKIFGDEVALPKSNSRRETSAAKQFGGLKFSELPKDVQAFIKEQLCVPIVLMSPDDKFERYIYEMLNAGCTQSSNDITNSQCAGNHQYEAAKEVCNEMLDPHRLVAFDSKVVASWQRFCGFRGKNTYNSVFNLITHFLARNEPAWCSDKQLKLNFYAKNCEEKTAKKNAEWAEACILHAIHVLDDGGKLNAFLGIHTVQGVANYLSDTVKETSKSNPRSRKLLKKLDKKLTENDFANKMGECIFATMDVKNPIRRVFSVFTAPDFGSKVRYTYKYSGLKHYETEDPDVITAHTQLANIFNNTAAAKARTDFVRCYLAEKVQNM